MENTSTQLIEELATLQTAAMMVEKTAMQSINELKTLQAAHDALQKQFVQVNNLLTEEQRYSGELKDMVNYLEQLLKGYKVVK